MLALWRHDWAQNVGPCQVCPVLGEACDGRIDAHHVLAKQALRKRGLELHVWDTRNRMGVCRRAHELHTNRLRPIPLVLVPAEAKAFAEELGLLWLLEKTYPVP